MDQFEIDISTVQAVGRELYGLRQDLGRHLDRTRDLVDSVPRSEAPKADLVANQMHQVYRNRADSDTGVQGVLEDYIEELDDMIVLIEATVSAYVAGEQEAAQQFRTAYDGGVR